MLVDENYSKSREIYRKVKKESLIKYRVKSRWLKLFFPITGLIATIWFFIRVLPKPSRALYPCQRVAFPLASSFLAYIFGIFLSAFALRKAKKRFYQSRYLIAGLCLFAGVSAAWFTVSINSDLAWAEYLPADPPNLPIGVAKGIHPGRVAWVHDPSATFWDPAWDDRGDIFYWDDDHNDQAVIDGMLSQSLLLLTEELSDETAWETLFRHFNQTKGKGNIGYTSGEKIVIKPNHVEQRAHADQDNKADLSPQIVIALLKQLVDKAGIPQENITLSDASRYIADKTFNRCYALFPNVVYAETNFYILQNNPGTEGRVMVQTSSQPMIHYSGVNTGGQSIPSDYLPVHLIEADYVLNLAIMKGHSQAGVTLCAKNWYGCFCTSPGSAHHDLLPDIAPQSGQYRPMVDLMGHQHLGEKTMLYLLDGLWGFPFHGSSSRPLKWQNVPFNNNYPSSILISQDPVAIDSVGLDFLRAEFADDMGGSGIEGAIDDYLHEAALAGSPPSNTFYDPEGDGISLQSIGVHEHWNNASDKQYTRNLGTGEGIELIYNSIPDPDPDDDGGDGDDSGDGDDGGDPGSVRNCFIATAAYDSPLHPHVNVLRDFRDKYLMPTKLGRKLVDLYYKYSPFIADLIAKNKVLRIVVRINLLPLVAFSYSILHFGPIITAVIFVFIFMLPIFLILLSQGRLRRVETEESKALASPD